MNKKCQVVMLPTNKISKPYILKCIKPTGCKNDKVGTFIYGINEFLIKDYNKGESVSEYFRGYHLYILSDDEIVEGDSCLVAKHKDDKVNGKFEQLIKVTKVTPSTIHFKLHDSTIILPLSYCKKIIGTTDYLNKKWLHTCFSGEEIYSRVPKLTKVFLKEYCKLSSMKEVWVEYTKDGDTDEKKIPYINSDNTINVSESIGRLLKYIL